MSLRRIFPQAGRFVSKHSAHSLRSVESNILDVSAWAPVGEWERRARSAMPRLAVMGVVRRVMARLLELIGRAGVKDAMGVRTDGTVVGRVVALRRMH